MNEREGKTRLKTIAKITAGQSPEGDSINLDGSGILFMQGSSEFGEKVAEPYKYTTQPKKIAPKGSLLISVRAPVGTQNYAGSDVAIGRGLASIEAIEGKSELSFLAYALLSAKDQLALVSNGTTFEGISTTALGNVLLKTPPLLLQQQIAAFLDRETERIDDTIRELEKTAALLRERWQAMISETVTKGFKNKKKDFEKLRHIVTVNPESLPDSTDPDFLFDYIEISDVEAGKGVINKTTVDFKTAPSRARRIVKEGDVIVSTVRTYLKAVAGIDQELSGKIVSTGFAVLRPNLDKVLPKYLQYIMESKEILDEIARLSTGVSYPSISTTKLTSIEISLPPLEVQQRVIEELNEQVSKLDSTMNESEKLATLLREKRQALISEAVIGLDVADTHTHTQRT